MKIILVTGANRGIGKETVRQLAAAGHKTILTGRNGDDVKAAQKDLVSAGVSTDSFVLDIREDASLAKLIEYVSEKYGKLDVLVNNAGVFLDGKDAKRSRVDDIRETFETNTIGPYRLIEGFTPLLQKSGNGRIINVSSGMGGLSEMNGGSPGYRLSKTALNAVTRIFANDLAGDGISVNSVCPGWVQTDMGGKGATRTVERGAETIVWLATAEKVPTGKFLRDKKEIAW